MKRSEVRTFLTDGIATLTNVTSGNGRISEFNSNRSREYPMAWVDSLSTSPEITPNGLPYDNWNVVIHIAKKDSADSTEDQYELIIDSADEMGQQLIKNYNDVVSGYKLVELLAIQRIPFIKKHADCLTGIELSFTLRAPDTTNLC